MLTLPRSQRWLLPAFFLLTVVLVYRSVIRVPASLRATLRFRPHAEIQYGVKVPQELMDEYLMPPIDSHLWPEQKYYYKYSRPLREQVDHYLGPLLQCPRKPNPHTQHIRLPNIVHNVSQLRSSTEPRAELKFNPTIIALPPWSQHQYLLVSRVVTEGFHQESLLCEADICHSGLGSEAGRAGEKECTPEDVDILGAAGGLHCATRPEVIGIPPTPAEKCEGSWASFPDIPGFHDPRIFWSGKGEPLIMVNSASRYACVGLWIADLRTLHKPLTDLLASQPGQRYHPGPLMSYPSLTELTRNPASTRASIEKNWFLFFPTPAEAFVHYDLSLPRLENSTNRTTGGRTFAKLIGNGFTTPNLTDPLERPCLHDEPDTRGRYGKWHQSSNSLKLILCHRGDVKRGRCSEDEEGQAVHFAVMHRKFSNEWNLPLRYERFFVLWEARPPFHMVAISRYPVLMWNETASGWDGRDNWADVKVSGAERGNGNDSVVWFGEADQVQRKRTRNNHNQSMQSEPDSEEGEVQTNHFPPRPTWHSTNPSQSSILPATYNINNTKIPPSSRPPPPPPHTNFPPNQNWAYFTYTPSIAWAFRPNPSFFSFSSFSSSLSSDSRTAAADQHPPHRHEAEMEPENDQSQDQDQDDDDDDGDQSYAHERTLQALNVGYLDDEVIVAIGLDDQGQGYARVRAEELLGCLRLCGGVS